MLTTLAGDLCLSQPGSHLQHRVGGALRQALLLAQQRQRGVEAFAACRQPGQLGGAQAQTEIVTGPIPRNPNATSPNAKIAGAFIMPVSVNPSVDTP